MEQESQDQAKLFPSIAAQLRNTLSTLQLAAAQLAPAAAREQDPELEGQPLLKAKVQKLFSQYGEGSFN